MPKSELRISMMGVSFSITADAEQSYLDSLFQKYLAFVNQTKRSTGLDDPLKLAILSGFLLYDEVEKQKNLPIAAPENPESDAAEALTLELISLIDGELPPPPAPVGSQGESG